jgi:hypothetical protein
MPAVLYRPGRGFHITRAGRDAWAEYELGMNIERKNPYAPLTAYFDISQLTNKELILVSKKEAVA